MGTGLGDKPPILVTGGSGFIGTHFCRRFEEEGRPYVILDLHKPAADLSPERIVLGDIRCREAVDVAMTGCDEVLHLAAAHHDSGIAEETYFDVNERGTATLAASMEAHGVRKICFYSSAAVYGHASAPSTELSPLVPIGAYGSSKLAGERVLEACARRAGFSVLIVRPSITFGELNFANMFSLIRQIAGRRYWHVGRSSNRKSLSYVSNLVDFTLWAADRHQGEVDVFNWVEAPDLTSREIVDVLSEALGVRVPGVSIPLSVALLGAIPFEVLTAITGYRTPINRMRIRKLVVDQTLFDASKARSCGFTPRFTLDGGLRSMVQWYRTLPQGVEPIRRIPPKNVVEHFTVL